MSPDAVVKLPKPRHESHVSLEQAIRQRHSVRCFALAPISLQDLAQLLWAAQGRRNEGPYRVAPSPGALYPLQTYVVIGQVQGLDPGVYSYNNYYHQLAKTLDGDKRTELARAASEQMWIKDASVLIAFSAIYERTTGEYGEQGKRFVHMEAGHAAQNVVLQTVALGLASCTVGTFTDAKVKTIIDMPPEEKPL